MPDTNCLVATISSRRFRSIRLGLVGAAGILVATVFPSVPASASSELLNESFRGPSAVSSDWTVGGSGFSQGQPWLACLTAGENTAGEPLPGCGLSSPDASGSGALRLTTNGNDLTGFALRNVQLPTSYGLDITFSMAQWGGNGADGISFFLVDGETNLTEPGPPGGALGYAPAPAYGLRGIAGGLMGIGFDAYGNYGTDVLGGVDCPSNPGFSPQRVSVRGPGNGFDGYCMLDISDARVQLDGTSREDSTRVVRVLIDPDSEEGQLVRVFIDGALVIETPVPAEFTQASTFKFGFLAATGGLYNIHEVWGLGVASVETVPDLPEPDIDRDGIPESLDSDIDGDEIPNTEDADIDGDGISNDQDPDIDGDGLLNEQDSDADGDGLPNAADTDADGPSAPVVVAKPTFTG
jgi:hypothetical protein